MADEKEITLSTPISDLPESLLSEDQKEVAASNDELNTLDDLCELNRNQLNKLFGDSSMYMPLGDLYTEVVQRKAA
jgi:hypothetical protein